MNYKTTHTGNEDYNYCSYNYYIRIFLQYNRKEWKKSIVGLFIEYKLITQQYPDITECTNIQMFRYNNKTK